MDPSSMAMPVIQGLQGIGEFASEGHITHPYFGRKMYGEDAVFHLATSMIPPLAKLRRPFEAAGVTDTDYYPEENWVQALFEATTKPWKERNISIRGVMFRMNESFKGKIDALEAKIDVQRKRGDNPEKDIRALNELKQAQRQADAAVKQYFNNSRKDREQ
jgi:hypothetical protein